MRFDHRGKLLVLAAIALALATGASAAAETLKIGGTGATLGSMKRMAEAFSKVRPDIEVEIPRSLGSTGGITAVNAGAIDIGLTSRALKDAEKQAGAVEMPYATTPFVFVTSLTTAPGLSRQDVVDIYDGRKTGWPDGQAIRILLRPVSDSDTQLLVKLLPDAAPGVAALHESQVIPVMTTDQDNLDAAEKLPGSFAAASLCTVLGEDRRVTVLAIDGVEPTLDNLASGAYPFSRILYFVTRAERSAAAQAFIDFVGSEEGRRVLRDTGSLPTPTKG